MVFSVSAFGGIHWNGKCFIGDSPTTTDILGPYYRPDAPMRSNIVPIGSSGTPMTLSGTIFGHDGQGPLQNALVEIWQCDEKEQYDNISEEYRFRGAQMTGADGRYIFQTIVPVPYLINPNVADSFRPAHIHMRVSVPNEQDLITQIYFQGDPHIKEDTWASSERAARRTLQIIHDEQGESSVKFDVIMNKEFPLDENVYPRITGLYEMEDKSNIEFIRSDDLLMMKRNGHLVEAMKYIGHNTFEGGVGFPKATFELTDNHASRVMVTLPNRSINGERFLKYS